MKQSKHFALKNRFTQAVQQGSPESTGLWFIFLGDKLLIEQSPSLPSKQKTFSPDELGITPDFSLLFGYYDSIPCFLAAIGPSQTVDSLSAVTLRSLFGVVDDDYFSLAGRALQILHHTREHIYCSRCATPMANRNEELAKFCPACGFISFPRVSPAVIMSVVREDHILLGRGAHFEKDMYSTLAGFVEAGETLEEAVAREVQEEASIVVDQVRYVTSQPWPFPHSVMIGYTAQYRDGELKIDRNELEDARWFHYRDLPKLPSRITIARLLIDNFINSAKEKYDGTR
ncbi:MAG: NAD+ diphosphatase [Desulforhopalus sp.]|jgi:NAD+ diphosphatase